MAFTKYRTLALSITAAGLLALAPQAMAQDTGANAGASAGQTQQMQVSDAEVEAYTQTAIEITKIQMEMTPQIKAAETKEQQENLILDMQKKMMSTVKEADNMTVEEYNQISQQAQQNPQLAQRIKSRFQANIGQQQQQQ